MGALMRYAFPYDMLLVWVHVHIFCGSNNAKEATAIQHVIDREGKTLASSIAGHHRRCRWSRGPRRSCISKQRFETIRSQPHFSTYDDGLNVVLGYRSRMHCHYINSHHNDFTREYWFRSRMGIAILFRFRLGLHHYGFCEDAIAEREETLGDERRRRRSGCCGICLSESSSVHHLYSIVIVDTTVRFIEHIFFFLSFILST